MSTLSSTGMLFQEEVRELLQELDAAILDLDPDSSEAVNRVFRALHSIKGACDMFGLSGAVGLLHLLESQWDRVRMRLIPASRALLDLTFAVKDQLEPVAEAGADASPPQELLDAVATFENASVIPDDAATPPAPPRDTPSAAADDSAADALFNIRLAITDPDVFRSMDPVLFFEDLDVMGLMANRVDTSAVPPLEQLEPAACALRWDATLATKQGLDAVKDVFLFLNNPSDVTIAEQPAPASAAPAPQPAPQAAPRQADAAPAHAAPPSVKEAAAPAKPAGAAKAPAKEPVQSLRVEAAKLDNLVNLVGELVIAQARLTQVASLKGETELLSIAEEIERLVSELRDNTLSIRMLPIGTTFSRFRRLVRDLSAELGKEIDLETEGGETELDKTVIEQLGDPLVHLLRNSIDHGIERPAERAAAGKPERGVIMLAARQAGGAVFITITDDGRGLDAERIKAKALERGIITPDARLTDQEAFQLIFAPGFSTADKVTNVSGRGVGMDVVKRSIESLRGSLDLDSPPGQGTRITIQLPLTLAIIDGLQVRAGEDHYIIPLSLVEECVELTGSARQGAKGRTIHLRGEIVPYVRLRETFALAGDPPAVEQVVITRHEHGRTGIAVDDVVGQQQTVIKNLGRYLGHVEGISGATINGDGSIALILDVGQLVQGVQREFETSWGE